MKRPKTIKDLRNDPRVVDLYKESNCDEMRWWVHLSENYKVSKCDERSTFTEATINDVCDTVHNSIKL